MPVVQNFKMYQGDTRDITVTVTQDGELMDLEEVDNVIWVLSDNKWSRGEAILVKSLIEGTLQITGAGEFSLKLSHEDTKDLLGKYFCEARVIDGIENNLTVLVGEIEVERSIIVGKELI